MPGQQGEFFDGFDFGKVFIHFLYFAVNQFLYLVILGQVGKGGKWYSVVLGIFGDIVFVDQDQGGQKFATIADDDGILDIGTELQLIFNKGRGNVFSASRDDDILFAIHYFKMTVFEDADVSGVQPAVFNGFLCQFRIFKIAQKYIFAPGQNFSVLGNFDLDIRKGLTDISQPRVINSLNSDNAGGFRLTVSLAQRHS